MITSLNGILINKEPNEIVIECGGVGYAITISWSTYESLPSLGDPLFIYTYLRILDDRHQLYGFTDQLSKRLFTEIIKVTKVGPSIAIAILSTFKPQDFLNIIASQDVKMLTSVQGIGGKTAARIAMELKSSLQNGKFQTTIPNDGSILDSGEKSSSHQEAILALEGLSVNRTDAVKIIKQVSQPGLSRDELIRAALNLINSNR